MQKMGAESLADLVRMAEKLKPYRREIISSRASYQGRMDSRRADRLSLEQMKTVEQSAGAAATENATPRRISIVDDDASIREALKSLMRSVRFDVEAFASAEEFLASERSERHRLSDPGRLLARDERFRAAEPFEHGAARSIPIIFITAHADEASRQRALKSGAVDFLGKPVRREALFKAIQSAIERNRRSPRSFI